MIANWTPHPSRNLPQSDPETLISLLTWYVDRHPAPGRMRGPGKWNRTLFVGCLGSSSAFSQSDFRHSRRRHNRFGLVLATILRSAGSETYASAGIFLGLLGFTSMEVVRGTSLKPRADATFGKPKGYRPSA